MSTQTRSNRRPGAARQRAATLHKQAQRAQHRRRLRTIAAVVAITLVVAVGIAVQASRSTSDRPDAVPAGLVGGVGVPIGGTEATVIVEVFEDFMCPACGQWESEVGPELEQMAEDGTVRVVYRPLAFLDRFSTTRYSTRAVNATGCAVDAGQFNAYHSRLFEAQPPEGGPGLSDVQLIELGRAAGITGSEFADCVNDLRYERWTQKVTDAASKERIVQTPTIRVNGEDVANPNVAGLREAVAAAS